MNRNPLWALALVASAVVPGRPCYAQDTSQHLKILTTIYVKVHATDTTALRQVVADFARSHGFPHKEEATLPRNRKIFLMAGGFSTTFSAHGDYYLVMHNIVGRDCVPIDLYATDDRPSFKVLMTNLRQRIAQAMPGAAKIVDRRACESTN